MSYLSHPDKSVTSFSWRGTVFESFNGRFWIDSEIFSETSAEMSSHGFIVAEDQSDHEEDSSADPGASAEDGAPDQAGGRPSKYKKV